METLVSTDSTGIAGTSISERRAAAKRPAEAPLILEPVQAGRQGQAPDAFDGPRDAVPSVEASTPAPSKKRRPGGLPPGFVSACKSPSPAGPACRFFQDPQGFRSRESLLSFFPMFQSQQKGFYSSPPRPPCCGDVEDADRSPDSVPNDLSVPSRDDGGTDRERSPCTPKYCGAGTVETSGCWVPPIVPASASVSQSRIVPYTMVPQPCLTSLLDGLLAEDVYTHIESAFHIGESWRPVLMPVMCGYEGLRVVREYERRCACELVLPQRTDVFSWTRYCTPQDVKVIIVGQDPYHRVGQAHGLAFSVCKGAEVPPSLRNILTAVRRCYPEAVISGHGNLEHWAAQGVLLLNTVLTVKEGEPGSHSSIGWTPVIRAILRHFENGPSGMVYLLWGAQASRVYAPRTSRHLVLKHSHPSPLSRRSFADCRHFRITNDYLSSIGKHPIDWSMP